MRGCFVFKPAATSTIVGHFKIAQGILQVLFKDSLWRSVVTIYNSLTVLLGKVYHVITSEDSCILTPEISFPRPQM